MKLSQAKAIATFAIKGAMALPKTARDAQYVVPYLISGAGLGKTSTALEIGADLDVPVVILSLAQYDYSEIAGWTLPNDDKTQMIRVRPDWMPTTGKGIIFLDELPQAPVTNQNIAAQLVNERRVGPHKLPQRVGGDGRWQPHI
jgi:MoxR-like ATPase